MPAVIPAMIPAAICVAPVSRRPPVASSPHPMVIAPSPASPHPEVTRRGTSRHDLNHRRRHGRGHDDRGRSHHHRSRGYDHRGGDRDSEADTDINPSIYSGDSQSCQGQDCDCLFHILYGLDAPGEESLVINRSPFCNPAKQLQTCLRLAQLSLRICERSVRLLPRSPQAL